MVQVRPGGAARALGARSLLIGTGLVIVAMATVVFPSPEPSAAAATGWPPGFGDCAGAGCPPGAYPDPGSGPITSFDEAINVFVGGHMTVAAQAAESEGRVVVMGDLTMDKDPGGTDLYNVGEAIGSRVAPPPGSVALAVGGDLTVAGGETLLVGDTLPLATRHAGALPGPGTVTSTGGTQQDPDAVSAYDGVAAQLTSLSTCLAEQASTGTVVDEGFQITFVGDAGQPGGDSAIQVFDLPGPIGSPGADVGISFTGIPPGATVIVNLTGATTGIHTFSGGGGSGTDPLDAMRERLLWNVPAATAVGLQGTAQLQGSVLVGATPSTTTLSYPGTNGRLYTAGDLVHTSSAQAAGGQEVHAYPFRGALPTECDTPATTTTSTSTTTTTAPSTTTSSSTSTSTTMPSTTTSSTTSTTMPSTTTTSSSTTSTTAPTTTTTQASTTTSTDGSSTTSTTEVSATSTTDDDTSVAGAQTTSDGGGGSGGVLARTGAAIALPLAGLGLIAIAFGLLLLIAGRIDPSQP